MNVMPSYIQSGGSRGGARGVPPLFLSQNEKKMKDLCTVVVLSTVHCKRKQNQKIKQFHFKVDITFNFLKLLYYTFVFKA